MRSDGGDTYREEGAQSDFAKATSDRARAPGIRLRLAYGGQVAQPDALAPPQVNEGEYSPSPAVPQRFA